MLIAVILGGAVCPKPILKVQFWMITFSRSMYETSTFEKIDIGSDDLSQIEATWLLTPPACRFWEVSELEISKFSNGNREFQ